MALIARGWQYAAVEYNDLEECYVHFTSSMFKHVPKLVKENEPTHTPRDDRREARAWRGRLQWDARLKPQAWDDEPEGKHIGGLRDVARSLDMPPEVSEKGLAICATLEKLYTDEPCVMQSTLNALSNKLEDCSELEATSVRIAECVGQVTG